MKNHCRCRGMEWRAYALLHVEVQKKTNDANGSKHTISQNEPILLLFSCVPYKSRSFRFASRMIHGTAQLTDKTNNINLFKFMANHKSLEIFSILCSFFIETEWLESALHLLHSHTHREGNTWEMKIEMHKSNYMQLRVSLIHCIAGFSWIFRWNGSQIFVPTVSNCNI